jgi:hypothetical protein
MGYNAYTGRLNQLNSTIFSNIELFKTQSCSSPIQTMAAYYTEHAPQPIYIQWQL